jgi:Fur family transcriptional regulator, ferric uptake regulator
MGRPARWHHEAMAVPHVPEGPAPGAVQRDTRQRRAVLAALDGADGFRSAQAIHASVRDAGAKVGLATVYRSLKLLSESGEVDVVRDEAGEQLYRRCEASSHHHHLVCVSCGTAIEVESAPVERWAARVGEDHGFSEVHHSIEVFGTCGSCVAGPRGDGSAGVSR